MVGSIKEVYNALQSAGYLISESCLRNLVRSGELPHMKSGNKALISFEAARAYIDERTGGQRNE